MTLDEIRKSPALRDKIAELLQLPELKVFTTALKEDIIGKLGYTPHIPNASPEFQMATWHCHIHGMQSVVKTMENIGKAPMQEQEKPSEDPYSHSIPPELRPDFKPPVPTTKK